MTDRPARLRSLLRRESFALGTGLAAAGPFVVTLAGLAATGWQGPARGALLVAGAATAAIAAMAAHRRAGAAEERAFFHGTAAGASVLFIASIPFVGAPVALTVALAVAVTLFEFGLQRGLTGEEAERFAPDATALLAIARAAGAACVAAGALAGQALLAAGAGAPALLLAWMLAALAGALHLRLAEVAMLAVGIRARS